MGVPKQKWTSEEKEALRAGVAKHGTGKWKSILKDPQFLHSLAARSNVDLKDKWRNMCVSASSLGSFDNFESPKLKDLPASPVANSNASSSLQVAQFKSPKLKVHAAPPVANSNATSSLPAAQDATADVAIYPSKSPVDEKTTPRYIALIFEAISTSKDPKGSDISAIISFIEQRTEVPHNFQRVLSSKLRRLVNRGKLEKVQNSYRIKKIGASGQRIPTTLKPKDEQHIKLSQSPPARTMDDKTEEAERHAAYLIADTENKSLLALEAVEEAERLAKMVEEAEALHLFAKEILERTTRGEDVIIA